MVCLMIVIIMQINNLLYSYIKNVTNMDSMSYGCNDMVNIDLSPLIIKI